ncbi:MAG: hypothetical protein ACJ768_19565 [Gaiellaceae bacterium]
MPVFQESMAGALIDSARISVMAALSLLPPREAPLIILPGEEEELAEEAAGTVDGCLEQAMEWLDAARRHTVAAGAPVTSLHIAGAPITPNPGGGP